MITKAGEELVKLANLTEGPWKGTGLEPHVWVHNKLQEIAGLLDWHDRNYLSDSEARRGNHAPPYYWTSNDALMDEEKQGRSQGYTPWWRNEEFLKDFENQKKEEINSLKQDLRNERALGSDVLLIPRAEYPFPAMIYTRNIGPYKGQRFLRMYTQ